MNNFKFEFQELIKERKKYHINDNYNIEKSWAKVTAFLSNDIEKTIHLLNEASEEEVLWISEVFEDIALKVKNDKYIDCLENLDKKYPKSNLFNIVQIAKDCHKYIIEKKLSLSKNK